MNISPMTIYWVWQIDPIRVALGTIAGTGICALGIAWLICMVEGSDWPKGLPRKVVLPIVLGSFFASILLPSTKLLCAMYVIPKVASSEMTAQMIEDGGEVYELGIEALKDLIKPKESPDKTQ